MWINALTVFQVENAYTDQWFEAFSALPLVDPVGSNRKSYGFTPFGEEGVFVDQIHPWHAFVGSLAERMLPSASVDREVEKFKREKPEMAKAIGDPDKLWQTIEERMLPHAAIRETRTPAVYCSETQLLYVFGQSKLGIEALIMSIRNALGTFVCEPLSHRIDLTTQLRRWAMEGPPDGFALGESAVFEVNDGATTTFVGQDLECETVQGHLAAGESVKRLALKWRDELLFDLTDKGEVRKIGPHGCKMRPQSAIQHWPEIMARLPALVADLGPVLEYDFPCVVREDGDGQALAAADGMAHVADVASESEEPAANDESELEQEPPAEPAQEFVPMDVPAVEEPSANGERELDPELPDEPALDQEPPEEPAEEFVPLVVPALDTEPTQVRSMLDRLATRHPPSAIVLLRRPADSYRAVYAWAADRGVPIVLADWAEELTWPSRATALVCPASEDEVVGDMRVLAAARGCKVLVARE